MLGDIVPYCHYYTPCSIYFTYYKIMILRNIKFDSCSNKLIMNSREYEKHKTHKIPLLVTAQLNNQHMLCSKVMLYQVIRIYSIDKYIHKRKM